MSHSNSLGMGGACSISGFALVEILDLVGMRQYVPPKCIVRRLRSVRQVHLDDSLRKLRRLSSSAGFMKLGRRVKPGTEVPLMVKACFVFPSSLCLGVDTGSGVGHLLMGLKKSLMALRFLLGSSIVQRRMRSVR